MRYLQELLSEISSNFNRKQRGKIALADDIKSNISEYNPHGPRFKRWHNKDKGNRNPNIIHVSINLFTQHEAAIEDFIQLGMYGNRSDTIRYYIKEGIKRDLEIIKTLERLRAYSVEELGLILSKAKLEKYKQIRDLKIIPNSVSDLMKKKLEKKFGNLRKG